MVMFAVFCVSVQNAVVTLSEGSQVALSASYPFIAVSVALFVGGIVYFIRHRAIHMQKKLEDSHEFLSTMMDSIPTPIFVKNSKHQWIAGNKAFWRLLGKPPEMMRGKSDYDVFPKEQADIFWEMDEKVLMSQEMSVNVELLRSPEGEDRLISTKKVSIKLENGEPGLVGIIEDITDIRRNQEELKAHRDNLQQMVELQTRDIVAAKEKAEASNQAKSEFLSNMSHELRTPMHAILNYSQLGRKRLGAEGDGTLSKYLHNIEISGNRLLGLLNNLLDLSKLEAGKLTLHLKPGNLHHTLEQSLIELDSLLDEKGLKFEIKNEVLAERAVAVYDHKRMVQVFVNMISNAIKFASEQSTITLQYSMGTITEGEKAGSKALQCSIHNSGVSIPDHELLNIFEKFTQSTATKTGAGGTGLGLSICREILAAQAGVIWAERGVENGARFHFMLPCGQPDDHEQVVTV